MIELKTFQEEITILCDWFGRTFQDKTMKRLYARLNASGLTTEEFSKACLVLFDSAERFPNPQAFIDAARGDRESLAIAEWDKVAKAAASSRPEYFLKDVSEAGLAALKEIGGLSKLGQTNQENLPFRRKEFLERWLKLDQNIKTESIELNYQPQLEGGNGNGKH